MGRSPRIACDTGEWGRRSLALRRCRRAGWDPAEVLTGHYILNRQPEPPFQGWRTRVVGGYRLHACPSLPLTSNGAAGDENEAVILGFAIDPEGRLVDENAPLLVPGDAADPAALADRITALAGRYIVLLRTGRSLRLFADPCCGIACFYDSQAQQVSSCIGLLLTRSVEPPESDPHGPDRDRAIYLFGHTRDRALRQLTGNHALDLESFATVRHWPPPSMSFEQGDARLEEIADRIGTKLARTLAALASRYSSTLAITAGADSRILLACGKGILNRIDSFYVYDVNWSTSIDAHVARCIAARLGLPLRVEDMRGRSRALSLSPDLLAEERAKGLLRCSFRAAGSDARLIAAMRRMPRNTVFWRGGVTEMTRANRWPRRPDPGMADPDGFLAGLLRAEPEDPRVAYWRDAARAWIETLPPAALPRLRDIAHAEIWLPAGASLDSYGFARTFPVNPFSDRYLIRLAACVPPATRKRGRLVRAIVNRFMPEIADVPFLRDAARRLHEGVPLA